MKKVLLIIFGVFTMLFGGIYIWGIQDIEPIDDSAFLPPARNSIEDDKNGYKDLEALLIASSLVDHNIIEEISLDLFEYHTNPSPIQIIEKFTQATEDHTTEALIHNLNLCINKGHFQSPTIRTLEDQNLAIGQLLNLADLIAVSTHISLLQEKRAQTVTLYCKGLQLSQLLLNDSQGLVNLITSIGFYHAILRSLNEQINAHTLTIKELNTITRSLFPQKHFHYIHRSWQNEFFVSKNSLLELVLSKYKDSPIRRPLLIHPNRTIKLLADSYDPILSACKSQNYLELCTALQSFDQTIENNSNLKLHGRNYIGVQSYEMLSAGVGVASKKTLEALTTTELIRLHIAIERYRLSHGNFPKTLAELTPAFLKELPVDPWTGKDFIYKPQQNKLYSVGVDGKDDGGDFDEDSSGKDIGIFLKP